MDAQILASKAVISNATVWDTLKLVPDGALPQVPSLAPSGCRVASMDVRRRRLLETDHGRLPGW